MGIDPVTTWHSTLPDPPLLALVGSSAALVRLRDLLAQAATGTEPLVIRGENGTGKTLAARVLAAQEPYQRTLVRVRCGRASPDEANEKFRGLLELSQRKEAVVLMLDEVGDAPSWLQDRVCAAISESSVRPPRIVSATARDLERLSERGILHDDFVRLLRGTTLWIPPLRVRRGDIRELVQHFLAPFPSASFDAEALEWLEAQAWPENVRQLREVVRRLVLLHDRVTRAHIRQEFGGRRGQH